MLSHVSAKPPISASSSTVSRRMSLQASSGTLPELELRRELHRRGRRFRVNFRPEPTLRRTPDVVFTRARVVVFVDGCFWHQCPEHRSYPQSNAEWWVAKLENNSRRDRDTDAQFAARGWTVVRVWEHMRPDEAADLVEMALDGGTAIPGRSDLASPCARADQVQTQNSSQELVAAAIQIPPSTREPDFADTLGSKDGSPSSPAQTGGGSNSAH